MEKVAAFLLLMAGLAGCRSGQTETAAREEQTQLHAKELFTDRASVLFAQQEMKLAQAKAAATPGAGAGVTTAEQTADLHRQLAALQLQIDLDNDQFDKDTIKLKALSDQIVASRPEEVSR